MYLVGILTSAYPSFVLYVSFWNSLPAWLEMKCHAPKSSSIGKATLLPFKLSLIIIWRMEIHCIVSPDLRIGLPAFAQTEWIHISSTNVQQCANRGCCLTITDMLNSFVLLVQSVDSVLKGLWLKILKHLDCFEQSAQSNFWIGLESAYARAVGSQAVYKLNNT